MLPVPPAGPVPATALAAAARSLARDLRADGHFADDHPLTSGSDNRRAWAFRPPGTVHRRDGMAVGRTDEDFRGAAVTSAGGSAAWLSLSREMFGALVDRESLRRDVAGLLALTAPHAGEAEVLAIAVRLAPAGDVREGDPGETGSRQSGRSGFGSRGGAIEFAAEFALEAGGAAPENGRSRRRARGAGPERRAPARRALSRLLRPSGGPPDRRASRSALRSHRGGMRGLHPPAASAEVDCRGAPDAAVALWTARPPAVRLARGRTAR